MNIARKYLESLDPNTLKEELLAFLDEERRTYYIFEDELAEYIADNLASGKDVCNEQKSD